MRRMISQQQQQQKRRPNFVVLVVVSIFGTVLYFVFLLFYFLNIRNIILSADTACSRYFSMSVHEKHIQMLQSRFLFFSFFPTPRDDAFDFQRRVHVRIVIVAQS